MTRPVYDTPDATVYSGDAGAVLRDLPTASVDMLCTDPPYGLSAPPDIDEVLSHWENGDDYVHGRAGFMNSAWDSFVPGPSIWREALRVVKPGAPAIVFAGSRTLDLMMTSLRLAGWTITGTRHWAYGSGMPKAMDIAKALERAGGVALPDGAATDHAARWQGWKTQLKGAHEPMVLAVAPGVHTSALAVGKHPYTAKAPTAERAVAYLPGCDCHGDPHALGASVDIATFEPTRCVRCAVPYQAYRHPTVKPLAVMTEAVHEVTPDALILDPFAGTGTTGVAAVTEGRRAVLIDADPVHAAMARHRLSSVVQPSLFDHLMAA